MELEIKKFIINICEEKIKQKGENVSVSFYAFFKNKNDDPETLLEVATWWIKENEFNHFEKATEIKKILKS